MILRRLSSRSLRTRCPLALLALVAAMSPTDRSAASAPSVSSPPSTQSGSLSLHLRRRIEVEPGSGRWNAITEAVQWDPGKTAVIVCDMWNQHWCKGATRRVAEMAPRMNQVLVAARKKGVLIIHCPSNTMKVYAGTPQRERARAAPKAVTALPLKSSCNLDLAREGKLPIDDSDGGCDCDPPCKQRSAWTRQIDTIKIEPPDAITDSREAFDLMKVRGIENVIVMGVHTNMCILGRPFSIRQLVTHGMNVVLMRDMTDTMYNSRSAPFVSHFTGTDLVVEHIEKHWCPTIASVDLLGGTEFRFSEDHRPHVAMLIAEPEYETDRTLPEFAAKELGKESRVSFVFGAPKGKADLAGLEAINDADVLLVSVRRKPLRPEQLKLLRDFIARGKAVVGIRTACHAFSMRGKKPKQPLVTWESWDPDVIGGHYTNHHKFGPKTSIAPAAASDPILAGVDFGSLVGNGSLYRVSPLAKEAHSLLLGTIPGEPTEPVAWTFQRPDGGKTFFTSLGHPEDFKEPAFRRLLVNALKWAASR